MKKFILVPDSFKGSMSSSEICEIMEESILTHYPGAQVVSIPVADGGEGSVDCFLSAVGGKKVFVTVKGPHFESTEAFYGILPDGTAVIEMAACAGLPLVENGKAVENSTTFGVGQLIIHAASSGCKKIIVGLGGSATNDGGAGAAAAAGVQFFDAGGSEFIPVGKTLCQIGSIDSSGLLPVIKEAEIITMCDVDNPLCGENGAAHVFGPQKGADREMIKLLDESLAHMAKIIHRDLNVSILDLPGSGAAGGLGGGMVAFFGSQMQMGIEAVLDVTGFDARLKDADMVFSGEGRIDFQSLRGKVISGVARRAKRAGVPVVAIVGDIGDGIETAHEIGLAGIFSINRVAVPFSEARLRCKSDLRLTMDNLLRYSREAAAAGMHTLVTRTGLDRRKID